MPAYLIIINIITLCLLSVFGGGGGGGGGGGHWGDCSSLLSSVSVCAVNLARKLLVPQSS